jgi:hypothetical protein
LNLMLNLMLNGLSDVIVHEMWRRVGGMECRRCPDRMLERNIGLLVERNIGLLVERILGYE